MYKGTNWTRGDLGHEIDRDPMIDCHQCDEKYRYMDYWKPRYVDGTDWVPRQVAYICDECIEQAKREHELHKKRQRNAQITEWVA